LEDQAGAGLIMKKAGRPGKNPAPIAVSDLGRPSVTDGLFFHEGVFMVFSFKKRGCFQRQFSSGL
jgi:hypothetical protein